MRNCLTLWLGMLGGVGLCLAAHAASPGPSRDQFQPIPERNVFGLKSAEAPPASPPKGPPPRLTLTGITTLLGNKLALLRAAIPGAPGQPAQDKPLMLTEGQREGNIEVLAIDANQRSVRVNDAGEIVTLTFAKNGVKPAAGAAPATPFAPALNPRMRIMPTRVPRTYFPSTAPQTGAIGTGVVPATNATGLAGTVAGTVPPTTPSAADTALSPTGPVADTNSVSAQNPQTAEAQEVLQALQQLSSETNATPAPPPPAPPPAMYSPYPTMPPGANLQRPRPPFFPQ